MPTAKKDTAPKTATVSETIIRKETRDPVEVEVKEPKVEVSPQREFWKYIQSLTDEDWKTHHVTLYRYPLGQPKPDKLGRYVKTYKHGTPLLSEDQIYEEFGGSQYTALLKGPGRNGDPWTLISRHEWEMDGPVKNPWNNSPSGSAPLGGSTELASTLQVLLPQLRNALQASPNAESPAIQASISLIKQLTDAMPKQQGISELVSGLADLKKLTGETGNGNSLRETLAILKELGIIGVERRSIAQEVKEIMEIAGMLGGGGAPARRADWPSTLVETLPSILEKVTPIADKFADAARANARVAEIRAGGAPRPPINTSTIPAAALPAAARPAGPESPAPRSVAAPETEPAATGPAPEVVAPNLVWAKAKAVQMFLQGLPGDEVAGFLDHLDAQLGGYLASMDEPKFRAFVEGDVILRQIVSAPRYPSFVKDFVAYFSEDEEGGADEETQPAHAG